MVTLYFFPYLLKICLSKSGKLIDLNNFFASVSLLFNPTLKDSPVAVCGDEENRHGIVLAKNEAAKKFGVKTAETIWQAKKKCPQLVTCKPHSERYMKYSNLATVSAELDSTSLEINLSAFSVGLFGIPISESN